MEASWASSSATYSSCGVNSPSYLSDSWSRPMLLPLRPVKGTAIQRLVPGDGLGCVGGALQREQTLLRIFFSLDLGGHVQRHHKERGPARILNRLQDDIHGEDQALFAAMQPNAFLPRHDVGHVL